MLKKRIKRLLRAMACKTILAPKSFSEVPTEVRKIACRKSEAILLTNTSNNVWEINLDNEKMYFRECKVHKEIHQYVMDEIDFYYTFVCPDLIEDKIYLQKALKDKKNLKKFVNMGMTNDLTSGAYKFCIGKGGEHIGLKGMTPIQEERLKDFVQFVWGDLFAYSLNCGVKRNQYQIYNAVRSIASYRIALLVGLDDLIPKTEYAMLCIDSKIQLFGTIMEQAPGVCMERKSSEERKNVSSPKLQRALNNLNVLDVICSEKDHRVGNYNVVLRDGQAYSVTAFDNDSPNSFGMVGVSFKSYMKCSPWTIDGVINRPFIDKTLAENILSIKRKKLHSKVSDLLNGFQMLALEYRIDKIKKLILSTVDERIISEEQWNTETINRELSGKYGDTYLSKFLQEQNIIVQPWIKEK